VHNALISGEPATSATGRIRRHPRFAYRPSKAALESETVIWAQDLAGTGVTVNGVLPGSATATGMIPDSVPDQLRVSLLPAEAMVRPLLWLASTLPDGVTGKRAIANRWRDDDATPLRDAIEDAGSTSAAP